MVLVVIGFAVLLIGLPIYFAETGEWHNLWLWAVVTGKIMLLFVVMPYAIFVLLPKFALKVLDWLGAAYNLTIGRIL
jgi:hypothetical protein